MLLRRETNMRGWSASVDGRSTKIRTTDGIFQSVSFGAGSYEVRFSYLPPHERLAEGGFMVGVLWLLGGMVSWCRRRRRAAPSAR